MLKLLEKKKNLTLRKDGYTVNVIRNAPKARAIVQDLLENPDHIRAIDFEGTGLRPEDGAIVRLSCISTMKDHAYVIDHFYCGSFESYADDLANVGKWYCFNNCFEGRFFDWATRNPKVTLHDVGHMRRSVRGGGPLSLATMIKWDLGLEADKSLQNSDWSNPELTSKQYFYGGLDAIHTRALAVNWLGEMNEDHYNGFLVINDCWRAVNECYDTGMHLDVVYHRKLIKMWEKRKAASLRAIRRLVSEDEIANIQSKKQISGFLYGILDEDAITNWPKTAKKQELKSDRNTLRAMSSIAPYPLSRFLTGLMVYNRAAKYLSTYGETLITKQELSSDNMIRGRLNMAAAITGRFSSSGPNMQNIPRSPVVRRSFITIPDHKMILADYSGIEIRVLAEMSSDKILLNDAIYDDVHARSAIAIYGQDEDDFFARLKAKDPAAKEMRSKAKGFTFQLLYGAGAAALSIVLRCSITEAEEAIQAWARRYSKAYHFRQVMFEKMCHSGFLPCQSGRTIWVNKRDRAMPVAANYPIQGSAGDVIYAAMTLLQKYLATADLPIWLMNSVHDEILLLADEDFAEEAKEILEKQMIAGWLAIFPDTNTDNLVDAAIGVDWSDKE